MAGATKHEEDIRIIWTENQWLYMVVGFIGGVLFCFLAQQSILNLPELVRDLLPEATGMFVTVTVIDYLNRRRDERNSISQLKEQLVRDASSMVNGVANNAVHQLRKRGWLEGENGLFAYADLVSANLHEADLRAVNLLRAELKGANLEKANLWKGNLQGAHLEEANLREAKLMGANLEGANLREANLQMAILLGANLEGADLREANLEGAKILGANLQGADLVGANLQKVDLRWAELESAYLGDTTLFDETSVLPDNTFWTPDTDMTKFTKPERAE